MTAVVTPDRRAEDALTPLERVERLLGELSVEELGRLKARLVEPGINIGRRRGKPPPNQQGRIEVIHSPRLVPSPQ